jgi:hypothetical protein
MPMCSPCRNTQIGGLCYVIKLWSKRFASLSVMPLEENDVKYIQKMHKSSTVYMWYSKLLLSIVSGTGATTCRAVVVVQCNTAYCHVYQGWCD